MNEIMLAQLAIKNRLYVSGWQMRDTYQSIIDGKKIAIHLLIRDDTPVAACTISADGLVSVFVKSTYRKKGLGRKVIEETLAKYKKTKSRVYAGPGAKGYENFFNSCAIASFEDYGCWSMTVEESILYQKGEITTNKIKKRRIKEYLEKLENVLELA